MIRLVGLFTLFLAACTSIPSVSKQDHAIGKKLAFSREKGNCLACHEIEEGEFPGNLGPALHNLPSRYRDKALLREQIWDATKNNPETSMPPFGKNKILTEAEIDQLIDYLWELH